MDDHAAIITLAVIASVFLGAISNWIYELLKNRGFFPDKLTVKATTIVVLASFPFVILIIFPQLPEQNKIALVEFLKTPIPTWLVILALLLVFLTTHFIMIRKINKLKNFLELLERKLTKTEEQLKTSEDNFSQLLNSSQHNSKDSIINPR